jgi:NAD(P)H-hydrate epimerase
MDHDAFHTPSGAPIAAVTAAEMREVDRVAVEAVGLSLARMMEHAGRALAQQALDRLSERGTAVVLAGGGGNGGGGLVCARHLGNRDHRTAVALDRPPAAVSGVPGEQLAILDHVGAVEVTDRADPASLPEPSLVVDALLGYGLAGAPREPAASLIEWADGVDAPVLSLDVPSGVDATTGETPGVAVRPDRILTLALPKTGLTGIDAPIALADLSIPAAVYEQAGVPGESPFGDDFCIELQPQP